MVGLWRVKQAAPTPEPEELTDAAIEETRREMKRRRYRRAAVWAVLLFLAALVFGLLSPAYRNRNIVSTVSDAFMLPGVVLTALGLVRMAGYFGSLDVVGLYLMRQASFHAKDHNAPEEREKRRMTLSDYRDQKGADRVFPTQDFVLGLPLTLVSLVLALSVVCG